MIIFLGKENRIWWCKNCGSEIKLPFIVYGNKLKNILCEKCKELYDK